MFKVKQYKLEMFGILICVLVMALCGVVTTQEALPYQYTPPYQNAFTHDRRRFNAPYNGYNGYNAAPVSPVNIRFPDDGMSPVSLIHGVNNENILNERHKKDNRNSDEYSSSQHPKSNEVSGLMQLFHFHKIKL